MPETSTTTTTNGTNNITNTGTSGGTGGADSTTGSGILKFPRDVQDMYHFMKFSSFEYTRTTRGQLPTNPGYTGHVILPLPANLMANYGANWGTSEFSPIQTNAVDSDILKRIRKRSKNWSELKILLINTQKKQESLQVEWQII